MTKRERDWKALTREQYLRGHYVYGLFSESVRSGSLRGVRRGAVSGKQMSQRKGGERMTGEPEGTVGVGK